MDNFPKAERFETSYSELVWDEVEQRYKYVESITYYCEEAAVAEFKRVQVAGLALENARNAEAIKATMQAEIDWVENAEATKNG